MLGAKWDARGRLLVTACALGGIAAAVALCRAAASWPPAGHGIGWVHDTLLLPAIGYGFYWGGMWTQAGTLAVGLILAVWWTAWVCEVPALSFPGFICARVYLGYVQPSGAAVVFLRRQAARLRNRANRAIASVSWIRPPRSGNRHGFSVFLEVADELARRDEEAVRVSEGGGGTDAAKQARDRLRQRTFRRLMFLADYHCPIPDRQNDFSVAALERAVLALGRATTHAAAADQKTRERLYRTVRAYYEKQFPGLVYREDWAVRLLSSPPANVGKVRRSPAVVGLLHRSEDTGSQEFLQAAEQALRRELKEVGELCHGLGCFRMGIAPAFQTEELRQAAQSASQSDLGSLGLGEVAETWLRTLLKAGDAEAVAHYAKAALELAPDRMRHHLESVEKLPWPESEKGSLRSILEDSALRRPEGIRFLAALAWMQQRDGLSAAELSEFAHRQAVTDLYERGDTEWLLAAERDEEKSWSN